LCEDAGGRRREDNLVLTELLLASTRPELNDIFRQWLLRRHKILRSMAVACDIDPAVLGRARADRADGMRPSRSATIARFTYRFLAGRASRKRSRG